MTWYYVEGGQQAGPVDDAQLAALASGGKILPETLVWCEGMAGWAAYHEAVPGQGVPPLAPEIEIGVPPEPSPAAAGGLICCECGRAFAADQVIRYGDRWVCAACKPIFLQRLREGATLAVAGPQRTVTEADLLARDYDVDIGGCLSQAWELFKNDAGLIVGASLLVGLALIGSGIIPYLGILLSLVFRGPLLGGLWLFYIKKIRRQEAGIGDAFAGFGPKFGQLFLTQLIPFLIAIGMVIIFLVLALLMGTFVGRGGARTGSWALSAFGIPMIILGLVFFAVMIYISVSWWFALPLVADKGLKFWPALQLSRRIVSKHWWMTFLLFFVCGFVSMVGVFACCVGILVTGPVAFAALAYHYEKVFGDLTPDPG